MDFTNASHQEVVGGLSAGSKNRPADVQAGQEQSGDTECVDPMSDAHGQLPDVGAPKIVLGMSDDIAWIERLDYFCHRRLLDAHVHFG